MFTYPLECYRIYIGTGMRPLCSKIGGSKTISVMSYLLLVKLTIRSRILATLAADAYHHQMVGRVPKTYRYCQP